MRVLVLHSRYLSGDASGENRVVNDELGLLRRAGHSVVAYTPSVDVQRNVVRAGGDVIWARGHVVRVRRLVRELQPDLVHVHSLYPSLSPAVLRAVPEQLPIVMTLHNFRLLCSAATLLRDDRICEDCVGKSPWRGVVHRCYRGSLGASAAIGTSMGLHRRLHSFERIRLFLAVSEFLGDMHARAGFPPDRVLVKRNFCDPSTRREGAGSYFLILSRLSREKGIDTVLAGWPGDCELVIAGDGPERSRLEQVGGPGIRFVGAVAPVEAARLLQNARALLVPSRCYEGCPRVVLEAFATGVPVIASRIGGLPELVDHLHNGLLVAPEDHRAWPAAIATLRDGRTSLEMGQSAYETWSRQFSPGAAVAALEAAYAVALTSR